MKPDGSLTGRLKAARDLNAFTWLMPEDLDKALAEAPDGPLKGKLVAIKDNIAVAGMPLTCASKILADFIAPYDATVVQRLKAAGAVIVGKTNMDEFAMGSSTEHSRYGATNNAVNPERVAGGSSGGSAVAVAAGAVDFALGSDTGGSIRQPAAFNGVVGLKPTYGRVSRYGLVAFGSSLDQIGPLTSNVYDAALVLTVISGRDPHDSTTVDQPVPAFHRNLEKDPTSFRVGLPKEYFGEGMQPEIREVLNGVVERLSEQGVQFKEVSLPTTDFAVATYYILACAEASSNLSRYDGVRYGLRVSGQDLTEMYTATRAEGFGPEVKRRIMLGTYVLSAGYYDAYYDKAQRVRRLIRDDFLKVFQEVDLLFTPTAPTTAFPQGERLDDPLSMYLSDIYTIPANLAGLPAMSLPVGQDREGLPIGAQLIGAPFQEETILQMGTIIERL